MRSMLSQNIRSISKNDDIKEYLSYYGGCSQEWSHQVDFNSMLLVGKLIFII